MTLIKKVLPLLLLLISLKSFAQKEERSEPQGFQKEKLFTGGSFTAGFSNLSTQLGISPQIGYSVTDWADVGIVLNFNYISQRNVAYGGDKLRQTTYGPGVFARLFPINVLFASIQYEYNLISYKYIPASGVSYDPVLPNTQVGSLLLGAGYAGGRYKGSNTYYFISISWDVLDDKDSPYVDSYGRMNPVIRAGYNIGLFQGRRR